MILNNSNSHDRGVCLLILERNNGTKQDTIGDGDRATCDVKSMGEGGLLEYLFDGC